MRIPSGLSQRFSTLSPVLVIAGGVIAVAVLPWIGCSVDEKNYKLLSFFFDGVPDPDAVSETGEFDTLPAGAVYVVHAPYAQDACLSCHQDPGNMRLTRDASSLCLKCHAQVLTEHRFLHGPVAGDGCLWCHNPHLSPHKYLLRSSAPDLCLQCHGEELMNAPLPVHEDLSSDCLSCHLGHGGPTREFLRDDYIHDAPDQEDISTKGEDAS